MTQMHLTSLTHQEADWYVPSAPELDIASQGESRTGQTKPYGSIGIVFRNSLGNGNREQFRSGQRVDAIELSMNREVGIRGNCGCFGA